MPNAWQSLSLDDGRKRAQNKSRSLSKLAARVFIRADVWVEEYFADIVAKTVETFGKLDFAFNNAGVLLESAPITVVTLAIIERILAVNLRASLFA